MGSTKDLYSCSSADERALSRWLIKTLSDYLHHDLETEEIEGRLHRFLKSRHAKEQGRIRRQLGLMLREMAEGMKILAGLLK